MTLPDLAARIRTHWRPLGTAQHILVNALEMCAHPDERQAVAGAFDMSGREIVRELLVMLPTATTEEQRWTVSAMRDLFV